MQQPNRPKPTQPIPAHAEKKFSGVIFDVYQWEQKLYDGSTTTFEKIKRNDSINILPINDIGEVVITKQKQPGSGTFYGTVGGRIDPGEKPLDAAARELKEEAGLQAETFEEWFSEQPVSKIDWVVYTVFARCLEPSPGGQQLDSGEDIELLYVSFEELVRIAMEENFRDKEIAYKLMCAKLDQEKYLELKQIFVKGGKNV